jgi:hypothetical protein
VELSAVLLARVLGAIEWAELSPRGAVFYPELVKGFVERCKFQKYPKALEDFDLEKGVDFVAGKWDGLAIEKITLYNNAILVDTRSSTDDSERVMEEILLWAASQFGLRYQAKQIQRKRFVSDLAVHTEVPILIRHIPYLDLGGPNTPLQNLCQRITHAVSQILGQTVSFEPSRLDLDFDRYEKQIPVAPFSIQRRAASPFTDNKYFSEAPLPTDLHYRLLQAFEADLLTTDFTPAVNR